MKKRILAMLLSALLVGNIGGCSYVTGNDIDMNTEKTETTQDKVPDEGKNNLNKPVDINDLMFVSNGNGTCYINGFQKDNYQDILVTLSIPASSPNGEIVTGIGKSAFWQCTNITSVEMSDSVTYIGNFAFTFCDQLKTIRFSNQLLVIGREAFFGCEQLENIELPQKLTKIGDSAFSFCHMLESVTIQEHVTSIGKGIFSFSENLCNITVDKNNSTFYSLNNCIIDKESKSVIAGCKNSVIPQDDNVICISSKAFCFDFSSFTIPNNIKRIEQAAIDNGFSYLYTIVYNGTIEEWETLILNNPHLDVWKYEVTVHCTDGIKASLSKG